MLENLVAESVLISLRENINNRPRKRFSSQTPGATHSARRPFSSYREPRFQNESSCKNEFALHENKPASETRIQMNGFARSLFLTQNFLDAFC